jgi:hypothetical protein
MDIGSVSPLQGIHDTVRAHAERAERLSRPEANPQLEKDLAELPGDARGMGAQAQVLKTRDRMVGDLLDILA